MNLATALGFSRERVGDTRIRTPSGNSDECGVLARNAADDPEAKSVWKQIWGFP